MLVLIVEDDPLVAMDLEDIVVEQTFARVVVRSSIKAALPFLNEPIDLALFDVDLMDGKSHLLASTLLTRNVPFFFVSGSSRNDLPESLRDVPFFAKPYLPSEITRAVAKVSAKCPVRELEPVAGGHIQ